MASIGNKKIRYSELLSRSGSIAVTLAAFVIITGAPATADVQIGLAGPMTGDVSVFGEQMKNGAQMAVVDINATGGINGENLVLTIGDDKCGPSQANSVAQAVSVAKKMVSKKVAFVVGHFCSSSSVAASRIYASNKVVLISPAATYPLFTSKRPGPGIYRVVSSDLEEGRLGGKLLSSRYAEKRIAIIRDDTPYGTMLASEAIKVLAASGIKPILTESYKSGQSEFTRLISKLKKARVDVIYIGGYYPEIGLFVRALRENQQTAQVLAGSAIVTDEFWKITGPKGEGTIMTFLADPLTHPNSASTVQRFREHGIEPQGFTLYSYVAVKVWAEAVRKAKSVSFKQVVQALNSIDMETEVGRIRFDRKGDILDNQFVWYVWHNGSYRTQD